MPLWSLKCVWQQHYQRGRGSALRAGSSSHPLIASPHPLIASPHVSGWGYWSSAKPCSGMPCRVQVSAHGTGASIPPVDEMVVSMKLITPAEGTITVSRDKCPDLFNMTRVGLGALGIVSEVTLQLVPAHHLLEHTFIMSSKVGMRRPCSICAVRLLYWRQAFVADIILRPVPAQHLSSGVQVS